MCLNGVDYHARLPAGQRLLSRRRTVAFGHAGARPIDALWCTTHLPTRRQGKPAWRRLNRYAGTPARRCLCDPGSFTQGGAQCAAPPCGSLTFGRWSVQEGYRNSYRAVGPLHLADKSREKDEDNRAYNRHKKSGGMKFGPLRWSGEQSRNQPADDGTHDA